MENILYILVILLLAIWTIGFVGYNIGGVIHLLLFFSLLGIVIKIIGKTTEIKFKNK